MAEGHRQRLKNRFLTEGLDGFEPCNALELLLFYTLPQADTNPIAHRLLDRFGSFSDVLDADYEDLLTVKGVKEHTATFIKLLSSASRYYQSDKMAATADLSTLSAIGDYLTAKYVGVCTETVYFLMLDNKGCLISCMKVYEGSVNSVSVSIRKLAETALKKRAAAVVLAHNHPSGLPVPSAEDIRTTHNLKRALDTLEIELVDHFIVAGNKYCTVINRLPIGWSNNE